jgi:hypothetical protein
MEHGLGGRFVGSEICDSETLEMGGRFLAITVTRR